MIFGKFVDSIVVHGIFEVVYLEWYLVNGANSLRANILLYIGVFGSSGVNLIDKIYNPGYLVPSASGVKEGEEGADSIQSFEKLWYLDWIYPTTDIRGNM